MFSFLAGTSVLVIVLLVIGALLIHFLPTMIAAQRRARNFWWIFLVNLFLGLTAIGWVVALVWALRDDSVYTPPYSMPPQPPQF